MYNSIFKGSKTIKFFDVTLRDGLQSLKKIYSLDEKKIIFDNIVTSKYKPSSIEIGSIVNPKIVPQMQDSLELFKHAHIYNGIFPVKPIDIYMLTPTLASVNIACKHDITNFSFITSVSNIFQLKNTNKTIDQTKNELEKMVERVIILPDTKIKLYISCITHCPINGKIENKKIISEILYYIYVYKDYINEFCLSDTCGLLQFDDFKEIIDNLLNKNINMNKLSLHLHNQSNHNNIEDILTYSILNGINKYDVSSISDIGGCSVTMNNPSSNLTYDQIYKLVV